jgi:hypothetical protein
VIVHEFRLASGAEGLSRNKGREGRLQKLSILAHIKDLHGKVDSMKRSGHIATI